jgi:hypothetical protein
MVAKGNGSHPAGDHGSGDDAKNRKPNVASNRDSHDAVGGPLPQGSISDHPIIAHPISDPPISDPGTLLWIGTTSHPEFVEPFRYCRDHSGQIAVRGTLREALSRPAGHVRRVIFARVGRDVPTASAWGQFAARYLSEPGCDALAIRGSLCDGAGRSGDAWPGGKTIRFSRWRELLPTWLAPCGTRSAEPPTIDSLLVLCDRFETAEPLLDVALHGGIVATWHRNFVPALHAGFRTVLWDDSVAPPAASTDWQQRLDPARSLTQRATPRHIWMALQPSIEAIRDATAGGIDEVISKPLAIDQIFGQADDNA